MVFSINSPRPKFEETLCESATVRPLASENC
jgi:hypothetical protein